MQGEYFKMAETLPTRFELRTAKYGLKFWVMSDCESRIVINIFLYSTLVLYNIASLRESYCSCVHLMQINSEI